MQRQRGVTIAPRVPKRLDLTKWKPRKHASHDATWWVPRCLVALSVVLWSLVALRLAHRVEVSSPLDFQVYRDAAHSMLHGHNPYRRTFTPVHLHFTYPPFALLLVSVFAVLPPLVALIIWSLLSALALVTFVAVALNAITKLPLFSVVAASAALSGASCLLLEPVRNTLDFGQINFFLMLAVLIDLTRARSSRGVLTGLAAAIKLTPLIYISYFVITRSRSSVARAIGAFVGVTVVTWLLLPADSRLFWFHQAFSPGRKGGAVGSINQSWFGLVGHLFPASKPLALAVWLVLSAATALVGFKVATRYVDSGRSICAVLALALTELLISPISWTHHWSWIILVPVLLLVERHQSRWITATMLLLLVIAVAEPYRWELVRRSVNGLTSIMVGFSLLLSGVALLLVMAATELPRRSPNEDVRPSWQHFTKQVPGQRGQKSI